MGKKRNKKVFFALHLYRIPKCKPFLSSLNATGRLLKSKGYEPYKCMMFGDPYIQKARNDLVNRFLKTDCDIFFFVADDLKFDPEDALKLIETPGEIVAGVYPMHCTPAQFGGHIKKDENGLPVVREDGCIEGLAVQTGFLRIDRSVFERYIEAYPEYGFWGIDKKGQKSDIQYDFFPQGVHQNRWLGEDYAFCQKWLELGEKIWIIPDIDFVHYNMEPTKDEQTASPGNFHEYLQKLPGGSLEREGKIERIRETRTDPKQSLQPLLDALPKWNRRMIEIGCYSGESIEIFHNSGKFENIHAVDPWEDHYDDTELISGLYNMDVVEEFFDKRTAEFKNVIKWKKTSLETAKYFSLSVDVFDFVYIDAKHDYKSVKEDILAWLPMVKPGGFIAGHDYEFYPGVKKAVDEIFKDVEVLHFPDTSWMVKVEE